MMKHVFRATISSERKPSVSDGSDREELLYISRFLIDLPHQGMKGEVTGTKPAK
jgi:hypothetical protein